MCLHPRFIANKGYFRLGGMPSLQVPCGCCSECANTKQIDYLLRSLAIYRKIMKNPNWRVFFSTLTFSEEFCPRHNVYRVDDFAIVDGKPQWKMEQCSVRCFDHKILQTFLKSFRQRYRRQHLPLPHILVTCEYGEDPTKTHRPHYHAIFFVPKPISEAQFTMELSSLWHYGHTYNINMSYYDGKPHERNVLNCFKYVIKYVTKGSGYLPAWYTDPDCYLDIEPFRYKIRVFTTNGYGADLEDFLNDSSYQSNKITLNITGFSFPKPFNIPAYYRRRYYTYSESFLDNRVVVTSNELPISRRSKIRPLYDKTSVFVRTKVTFRHYRSKKVFADYQKPSPWSPYPYTKLVTKYDRPVYYRNNYETVRLDALKKKLSISFDHAQMQHNYVLDFVDKKSFISYMMRHYIYKLPKSSQLISKLPFQDEYLEQAILDLDMLKNLPFHNKSTLKQLVSLHNYINQSKQYEASDLSHDPSVEEYIGRRNRCIDFNLDDSFAQRCSVVHSILRSIDDSKIIWRRNQAQIKHNKELEWYKLHRPFDYDRRKSYEMS